MAITAENCAAKYGITREQDAYALRSAAAGAQGVDLRRHEGRSGPRRDQDAQGRHAGRAGRPPASRHDDGDPGEAADRVQEGRRASPPATPAASSMAPRRCCLRGEGTVKAHGLKPLGRIVSWATVGVEPTMMGMGPAPAIRKALETGRPDARRPRPDRDQRGVRARSIWPVEKELGLDRDKVNVNGGAIALGHPLGRQRHAPAARRCCSSCGAAARSTAWPRPASAAGRASR